MATLKCKMCGGDLNISEGVTVCECEYCGSKQTELGLSMSAAFTIFAKKVGREKRIPFEVSVDPFYSEGNIRYLEKIMLDIKEGRANFAEHELMEND